MSAATEYCDREIAPNRKLIPSADILNHKRLTALASLTHNGHYRGQGNDPRNRKRTITVAYGLGFVRYPTRAVDCRGDCRPV
jgi:hypothetical protein